MHLVLEGILFGLTLTILMGPIFIALTQTTLEKGFRPGITVALGVWISDFIIIAMSFLFINEIKDTIESESFKFWLGLIGGIVLICFGLVAALKKVKVSDSYEHFSARNYIEFWLKGFLVNTVNPFTFIFWLGTMSTIIIGRQMTTGNAVLFLSSILLTIVVTDSLKVIGTNYFQKALEEKHIRLFSQLAGIGLIGFGIYLIVRSM